ncbi:MAG: transglutaminase domain-containing protein [Ruminiclostridium sp.]|nr:transglutaminase domain-containing protein [Ruminiclostridium sp.]
MSILYDIINILPFSLLAAMLFGSYTGMPEDSAAGFIICLALSLLIISLRGMKRKNRLRGICIAAVFIIVLTIAAGEENRQLFLKEYLWVLHIIFLSAAALITGILALRNIWIRRAAAAALLIYAAAGTVLSWEISKEAFALICFIVLVRIAEEIQRGWVKSGSPDIKAHITGISPMLIAVCLITYLVPAPAEPYDWQFAKDIYNNTSSFLNRIYGYITHLSDDYGSIGFSDSGTFLAGLQGNDEEVLRIEVGDPAVKEVRLTGCISGDFTGREWVFDTDTESDSRMTDTAETACAVRKYAGAAQSDLLRNTNMYFKSFMYNTKYIFSPEKIRLAKTKEKLPGISERNGSIITEQRLGYNDSYLISCYVLNYSSPELPELLENAEPITEDEWEQTAKAENISDNDGYSFGDHQEYISCIYEKYCIPRGLSERAKAVINDIKNSSDSRYGRAKMLEAYLKKLEYSTDTGALPDTVTDAGSFLDHFLFTSKKGWCMHFATAFVLMADEMGIPCRYVQGYTAKRDISGDMIVKQSNAHAWPEVYFDNVGWVAFEPTPGFAVPVGWGRYESTANTDNDTIETDTAEDADEESDISEGSAQTGIDPMIFIIPAAAVAVSLLIFYIISRFGSRRRYEQMTPQEKFTYLTKQDIRLLGLLGFSLQNGETLSEYYDRIMRSESQDIKEQIGFIPLYETVLYSDREITADDIEPVEAAHKTLRELAKKSSLRSRLLLMIREY